MDKKFVQIKIWNSTRELISALAALHGLSVCSFVHKMAVAEGLSVQTKPITDTVSVQTETENRRD